MLSRITHHIIASTGATRPMAWSPKSARMRSAPDSSMHAEARRQHGGLDLVAVDALVLAAQPQHGAQEVAHDLALAVGQEDQRRGHEVPHEAVVVVLRLGAAFGDGGDGAHRLAAVGHDRVAQQVVGGRDGFVVQAGAPVGWIDVGCGR
jgi:ribosomal protein L11 methylase PrmA